MIHSILDNDLYKFSMQNAVVKLFPRALVRFTFINRAKTPFPAGFAERLKTEVKKMENLQLSSTEKNFLLQRCYYLDPCYADFLQGYRYNADEVKIDQHEGDLKVTVEGYWFRTILWEVPLMALISELYFEMMGFPIQSEDEILKKLQNKAQNFSELGVLVADFGTRRRYSYKIQELVVKEFSKVENKFFVGTSNFHFAQKYNLTPIGTHAHEWFMFHAAKYGFKMANKLALENWVEVYRGDLGIALSDTYTTDVFFKAFDTKFAKLFDGVRHDSGDPLEFADKTIAHYQKLRIDPLSKVIVFSDGLDLDAVKTITKHCKGKIKTSYGIGTNLTNDVGVKPLNMVIKLSEAKPEGQDWISTVKLSDVAGKYTGDNKQIQLCKDVLNIQAI